MVGSSDIPLFGKVLARVLDQIIGMVLTGNLITMAILASWLETLMIWLPFFMKIA